MDVPKEVRRLFDASIEHVADYITTMHAIDDQCVDTQAYAIRQLLPDHQSQLSDLYLQVVVVFPELLSGSLFHVRVSIS